MPSDRKGLLEETLLKHPPSESSTRPPTARSPGKLRRRARRQAAGLRHPAGQDAGRRRPQGAGRRPDPAELRIPRDPRDAGRSSPSSPRPSGSPAWRSSPSRSRVAAGDRAAGGAAVRSGLSRPAVRRPDPRCRPSALPGYDAPPEADPLASAASPRILQLLCNSSVPASGRRARGLAIQIDRESRDELP